MLNINDATIRKYETFQFVTYNFKDLNIKVSKSELIEFLKSLYKTLSSKEVIDKKEEMKQIKVMKYNIYYFMVTLLNEKVLNIFTVQKMQV